MRFTLDDRIMPILERFRLDHLARLGTIQIDRDLITAMCERWRRETHSFHLPVGELTPTLEDVSCLWGLPIDGLPVIGFADDNWDVDVERLFGRLDWTSFRRAPGTFHMSRNWLCEPWLPAGANENDGPRHRARLPADAGPEEIRYYARAFMMDLFSSVMFPDHSGYIQSMFLQFVDDLDSPPQYSWATAVLAHLYRGLDDASENDTTEISAPLAFLQIWIWTRCPLGRPLPHFRLGGLQGEAFGWRWRTPHVYEDESHSGVGYYRYNYYLFHWCIIFYKDESHSHYVL